EGASGPLFFLGLAVLAPVAAGSMATRLRRLLLRRLPAGWAARQHLDAGLALIRHGIVERQDRRRLAAVEGNRDRRRVTPARPVIGADVVDVGRLHAAKMKTDGTV